MPRPAPLRPFKVGRTLVDNLAKTAAELRQLATDFGIRPYRVYIARVQWSGFRKGEGSIILPYNQRIELLPTPKIVNWHEVKTPVDVGGRQEIGPVVFQHIPIQSATYPQGYNEDDLRGNQLSRPLAFNEQVWYEVIEDGGTEKLSPATPLLRRFKLAGVVDLRKGSIEWELTLTRTETVTV